MKKPFRITGIEKTARLDIRISEDLRKRLEIYCKKHKIRITRLTEEALEKFISEQPQ